MTQPRSPDDDPLDAAFAQMRDAPPTMPDGLMAKVMADALAEMPKPAPQPFWKQVFGTLGGWPAMAGLAVTACVGLWIGGVYSDNLSVALGLSTGVALEFGETLGTYDLLLLDG